MSTTTGAVAQPPYASVGRRISAHALDALVVLLAYAVALLLGVTSVPGMLCLLVALAYGVLMWLGVGLKGHTPGMRLLGLRVAGADSGRPIGLFPALLRQLVLGVLGPVNLVQLFLIPNQERRQGWHDLVANSVVYDGAPVAPATATPAAPAAPTGPIPARPSLATAAPPSIGPLTTRSAPSAAVIGPPPGMIPPPPIAPAVAVPPTEPSHETLVPCAPAEREPVSETVISPRATAARPTAAATWKLTGPRGVERVVADLVLAGRDPDTALVTGATGWSLEDPELTVSKTHALFGLADGAAWVEDWHSTNGVLLRRGGDETELPPHERTPLQAGDEVLLGDFALTVEEIR